ncbi:integrase [Lysobacter niastensis]|uniref:Integrase n=1 Tax=Lysobacter niastensis TaxID=380629 RepID=A0ABU1W914_9GAMM|nr:integrase arm-type DNA-binding domain-containing protein [Lysobacter niastensis]MDR7134041.1 integrase [Lysobacter niastensis]
MATATNKLTALSIKSARAGKHADGLGLYLEVTGSGGRYWRMKYRFAGKEKRLAFGVYPEVGLAEARERRDEARRVLRNGQDPSAARAATKAAAKRDAMAGFELAATAWLEHKRPGWAPETYRKAKYVTEMYLIPKLRRRSVATLTTKDAVAALVEIGKGAPALAAKARQYLQGITRYAEQHGLREDGRVLSLRGAVPTHEKGHIPAATNVKTITTLVKAIENYPTPVTRAALKLAMLTAMRPGIVAAARWDEIDLDVGEWHVAGHRMKTKHDHLVPLPTQAISALREMQAYKDGRMYVFPPLARQATPHLHRDALSAALRRLGFQGQHATHGFRGMLRTVARERLNVDIDVLEAQLAHAKRGDVQKAYDRTTFGDARREAMQAWADYLDNLRQVA